MVPSPQGTQFSKVKCKNYLAKAGFTEAQAEILTKYFEQLYAKAKSE